MWGCYELLIALLSGLLLGLSLIVPIGPQNVFVLSQGLLGGWRAGVFAACITGVCDTLLILAGGGGLTAVLAGYPGFQTLLIGFGTIVLLYLGVSSLLTKVEIENLPSFQVARSNRSLLLTGVGVSWGNPHAILDTVIILGSSISAQEQAHRMAFALGAILASWLFFAFLATIGALFGTRFGTDAQVWMKRISGVVMLVFACVLASKTWVR